jgi:hypothetical protein
LDHREPGLRGLPERGLDADVVNTEGSTAVANQDGTTSTATWAANDDGSYDTTLTNPDQSTSQVHSGALDENGTNNTTTTDPGGTQTVMTPRGELIDLDAEGRPIDLFDENSEMGTRWNPVTEQWEPAQQPDLLISTNARGDQVLIRDDGTAYNFRTGQIEDVTEKMIQTAEHSAPKFVTGQIVSQGAKFGITQAEAFAIAGLIDGNPALTNKSLTVLENAARIGKIAPAAAAPVGMYMDIRSGVAPGEAISAGTGTVGAAAAIGTAAVLGTGIAPALVAAGVGMGAYYGTRWAYGKLPDGVKGTIDDAVGAVGHSIGNAWNSMFG